MPDEVMKRVLTLFLALLMISVVPIPVVSGQTPSGTDVVHAVLFYSSSCPHCHFVINEVMPPLLNEHGNQLELLYVNVQKEKGEEAFWTIVEKYQIPQNRQGVPLLVIGEDVYVGGAEIPQRLPRRIEEGLKQGGIPWPDFAGMDHLLDNADLPATATHTALLSNPTNIPTGTAAGAPTKAASPSPVVMLTLSVSNTETPTPQPPQPGSGTDVVKPRGETFNRQATVIDRIQQDLTANLIAIVVLIGMVASVISVVIGLLFGGKKESIWPDWVIPALCGMGMAIAAYLTLVELSSQKAICGPVGDCHTVQLSPYARIGGVIPVGLLGVIGYVGIGIAWFIEQRASGRVQRWSGIFMWTLSLVGTLFSIYLTFLEPFIIGATCAWCLTSSVIITLIMWAASAKIEGILVEVWR